MPQEAMVHRFPRSPVDRFLPPVCDVYKEWEPISLIEEEIIVVID